MMAKVESINNTNNALFNKVSAITQAAGLINYALWGSSYNPYHLNQS